MDFEPELFISLEKELVLFCMDEELSKDCCWNEEDICLDADIEDDIRLDDIWLVDDIIEDDWLAAICLKEEVWLVALRVDWMVGWLVDWLDAWLTLEKVRLDPVF